MIDDFTFGVIWGILMTLATLQILDKLFEYLLQREKIKLKNDNLISEGK